MFVDVQAGSRTATRLHAGCSFAMCVIHPSLRYCSQNVLFIVVLRAVGGLPWSS